MSKFLSASKQLMQTYLTELLTEEVEDNDLSVTVKVKEKQSQPIEQLLSKISLPDVIQNRQEATDVVSECETQRALKSKVVITTEDNVEQKLVLPTISPKSPAILTKDNIEVTAQRKLKNYRQGDFQAIFFKVANLTIALPLIELGGIHNKTKTTGLMGKPDWFEGVMVHRDEKINVVDTARWVMPEKCDETLLSSLNYQYIIMLNDSCWGLMAESLVNTETLTQEDVKWLDSPHKRPWLAGLVKNRMCALLDVDSLISLLEKGVNISQE